MKVLLARLLLPLLGLISVLDTVAAEAPAASAEAKPTDYFIVVTGGELLEGAYPDGHTHFLTRTLRPLGCRCVGSLTVDDHRDDIQRALRFATNQAALVLVTGGLGPTPNDITRETLSEFTGIPLREHPDALAEMERRFKQPRDELRPNLRRQTLVPQRGGYLKNGNGTAVGLVFDAGGPVIVALPGPPRELQPMVREELVPYLRQRFGVRTFGHSLTLRFVGAGQSLIDQTIKDHVAVAPDVVITSLFEGSRVDFTFTLPGHTPEDEARLKRLEAGIREHLAEYLYADDGASLEAVVLKKLEAGGGPMVIAEVGSGGQLAAALGGVKDAGSLLAGAYTAPTEAKLALLLGLVTDQSDESGERRVKALAAAAASRTQAPVAIAVGAIEADATGARGLWIALRWSADRWLTRRVAVRDTPEVSRASLVTAVLDQLRK